MVKRTAGLYQIRRKTGGDLFPGKVGDENHNGLPYDGMKQHV
jgi:hypothetical protein